jgi:hypothetical protein
VERRRQRQMCIRDRAGTWKHSDLPPPVGKSARQSFWFKADCMMSS